MTVIINIIQTLTGDDYMNYYEEIKEELINNEINKKVKDYSKNKYELKTYYNVGKLLIEAQGGEQKSKYGNKLIKEYAIKLTNELGKGYGWRNLYNMKTFYLFLDRNKILQPVVAKLNWTQVCILITLKDIDKINYYIGQCINSNLSKRKLQEKIKSKEYERLPEKTKEKLKNDETLQITDWIKSPIIIKNNLNVEKISEQALQKLIIDDVQNIMKQLGEGFSFIDNEYKIKIGNNYNYIDILLFNIKYNCYTVVELKVTELKKEHIGQVQTYMNYIDKNIKQKNHNKTIGIIIVKKDNKYILEYSSDKRINSTEYILI